MKQHTFITACVSALGEDINEMCDIAHVKDLSTENFIAVTAKKAGIDKFLLSHLGYETKAQFAKDWALRCKSSFYQGIPCYFVDHSRIEHVFVAEEDARLVLNRDEAIKRQYTISDLSQRFEEVAEGEKPSTPKNARLLLLDFYRQNKPEFESNRILLASIVAYNFEYGDVAKKLDQDIMSGKLNKKISELSI